MEHYGKFQLLEKIGEGGMAEIFLARPIDAAMSKLVAIKRILPQHADDPAYQDMLRREGTIALKFRHPSIIGVNEMGTVDGKTYISMEYFPAITLAKIMLAMRDQQIFLKEVDKVLIVKCVAEALHYMHTFGYDSDKSEIIHRDISPHNVMVGFDGVTKLIDFGIAKDMTNEVTQSRQIKGKVAYMSPEQVRGETLNKQTDIFSLGIVLWELIASKKLFTAKNIQDLASRVTDAVIPAISDIHPEVTPELSYICHKALSREREFRYQSAGDLAADLNDYLKKYGDKNQNRRLARFIQKLFNEDFKALMNLLKRYEGNQASTISHLQTFSQQPTVSISVAHEQLVPPKTRKKKTPTPTTDSPLMLAAMGLIGVLTGGMLVFYTMSPAHNRSIAQQRVPMPAPAAPTAPVAPVPLSSAEPTPDLATPTSERKPTSKEEGHAFLTVQAAPRSQIFIDGKKSVGPITDKKMRAGQDIKIVVIPKTGPKRTRVISLPAGTYNTLDMSK